MKNTTIGISIASICAVLVGCGSGSGSDSSTPPPQSKYSQMVVFGDSLSDAGTYKVGTIADYGGGKYTINSPTAKIWVDHVADYFGLQNTCAAQTGLPNILSGLVVQYLGASIFNNNACANYAQGGARVSNPLSLTSYDLQQALLAIDPSGTAAKAAAPLGTMATPVAQQMGSYLTRNGGTYTGKELVTVLIGANDIFMNMAAISEASTGGPAAVGAAKLAGWPEGVQAVLADTSLDPTVRVNAAMAASGVSLTEAVAQLLGNIEKQILAKGAKAVVVSNIPDIGLTPSVLSSPSAKFLATSLVSIFNDALKAGLATPKFNGVTLVDSFKQSQTQAANPSEYGLSNITDVACGYRDPVIKEGSLGCTAATTISADTSRYMYADNVHPTPYAHSLFAQYFIKSISSAGLGK